MATYFLPDIDIAREHLFQAELSQSYTGPVTGNTRDCYYCGRPFPVGGPPMKWRSPKGRYFIGLHEDCYQIMFPRKP
jgi:hypothetical protein